MVDLELWERANQVTRSKQKHIDQTRNRMTPFLLRGFVYCGACGRRLLPQNDVKYPNRCMYRCNGYMVSRQTGEPTECPSSGPVRHLFDPEVWSMIKQIISDDRLIRTEVERVLNDGSDTQVRSDLESTRRAIKAVRKKVGNLVEALADVEGAVAKEAIKAKLAQSDVEVERLKDFEARLAARLRPYEDRERTATKLVTLVRMARERIGQDELTMDQKRDVMTMLGIRVIVAPDRSARIQLRTDYDPLPVPVEAEASALDAGDAGQAMTRSFLNRSMAVCSVKSRLQKQNRMYFRPRALSWKKLEPGTVATPRSRTRWRQKATSSVAPKAVMSAIT